MTEQGPVAALKMAKEHAGQGRFTEALAALRLAFGPETDFVTVARAAKWSRGMEWPELRTLRVAFLGGGTLGHFVDALGFWLLLDGFRLEPYLASYDTWRQDVLDPASALYAARPELAWFFTNGRDLRPAVAPGASREDAEAAVRRTVEELASLWDLLLSRLPVTVIQNNADPPLERTFGNYEALAPWSRASLLRRFNLLVSDAAASRAGVLLFDLAHVAATIGLRRWHDPQYWFHSKHAFAPELTAEVAFQAERVLSALKGGAKKCIVLDLDNTLWGGVLADDGLDGIHLGEETDGEAFVAFQEYLKALARRGIVLAVCSKNEDAIAREPFQQHPAMRLRLEDIAVFKANWNNKADNIREIAAALNLGLDSFVFIDDNPAERALVRAELPQVTTPELPGDPTEYVPALDRLSLFETCAFSEEDRARGRMYRENAARSEVQSQFTDISEYLRSLEMYAEAGTVDTFHLPRMAQLVNKSNQFHPTTTRYTETELAALAARSDCVVRWFSLQDRFGDYGLIAVLVLKRDNEVCWIDTWAMSCRVLSRGMEEFICRELVALARTAGAKRLCGRYWPTKRNGLVAELYGRLGFKPAGQSGGATLWELALDVERSGPLFIRRRQEQKG